ncbi:alpha/beta fold hydrolase [Ornithinibacillus salinisoli]|uniref:Alpha/beta fold hydrolase n=1 Tax=Ornithinibacillus salinisoli TaxID=1848459 RepID=A0ABW4VUR8_9BACI
MNDIRQFLKVNKKKIEILQKGNKGTPIIVLTGMGCSFDEWKGVTESLCKTNRIILFHRPGLGESEIGSEIRNTQTTINELSDILHQLKIYEPVILVGHSYGGLCVQHFAIEKPEKVAGIVLVDSTSVDLKELDELDMDGLDEGETDEDWIKKCLEFSTMEQEQLRKIINPTLTDKQKQFPRNIQERLIDFQIKPSLYKAMHSEISNWKKDAEMIKAFGNFSNVPLIVIGRDKEYNIKLGTMEGLPEVKLRLLEEKWQELIKKQGKLSKNSELIIAMNATHAIHLDRPDVIIESINKLI